MRSRARRAKARRLGALMVISLTIWACGSDDESAEVASLREQVEALSDQVEQMSSTTAASISPPTTETLPPVSSTTVETSTPRQALDILQEAFAWNEESDRVRNLQALIGATGDGRYGPQTRRLHLLWLSHRGLPADRVPAEPPPPKAPDGGLIFGRGGELGQDMASGNCANWTVEITNSSNVQVRSFTFAPPYGYWWERSSGYGQDSREITADAPQRTLQIDLPPYETRRYRFQICTTTPRPGSGWEYGNYAPRRITFQWANGTSGSSIY